MIQTPAGLVVTERQLKLVREALRDLELSLKLVNPFLFDVVADAYYLKLRKLEWQVQEYHSRTAIVPIPA